MNAYAAIIFAVVLAAAQAMPQGLGAPPSPPINDVLLEGDSFTIGDNYAGSFHSTGINDVGKPSQSVIGSYSFTDQDHAHIQFGKIFPRNPSTGNDAAVGDHALINNQGTGVSATNTGSNYVSGSGVISNHAQSSNVITHHKD